MKKTNKKGFTLVEIMIVVAIIGLLAAIGIPSFQKARANSIEKAQDNNCRIVDAAIQQWAMETQAADDATIGDAEKTAILDYLKATAWTDFTVGSTAITLPGTVEGACSY